MVADISQASTLPVGPTRFAARIVWLPAPQARSRTRMPGRTPAISMSVSVADDSPAENSRSHFAQPGAAFSQVLRSSDFEALSAISESCFSGCIAMSPKRVSTLQWSVEKNLDSTRWLKSISGADPPRTAVPSLRRRRLRHVGALNSILSALGQKRTCGVLKVMSDLHLKADIAFRALTTDFNRFDRPLFRNPDGFAAIHTSLLFRRHSWRRHVGDPI